MRVTLVGAAGTSNLESSYRRAFTALGHSVNFFDIHASIQQRTRMGAVGKYLNTFLPVEQWGRKGNRELVIAEQREPSDLFIVFASAPVQAGALAQIKAATGTKLLLMWPDTLVNLTEGLLAALPLYDLIATYSHTSERQFQRLGARRTMWLPLAADPELHAPRAAIKATNDRFHTDVAFVGGWRAEREAVLNQLTSYNLKIWGPEWGRRCKKNPALLKAWQGQAAIGTAFSQVAATSAINLNIVDETNYPAANMRFFELPMAGGFQLCSPVPEMDSEFKNEEHLVYTSFNDGLVAYVEELLRQPERRQTIIEAAHTLVVESHTYPHRVRALLTHIEGIACNEP